MGEPRKGLKITYTTDTRPTDKIVREAEGADIFICEGMYGEKDEESISKAREIAKKAQPKEMWLTHYSPSMIKPEQYTEAVQEIFERAVISKDRRTVELNFEED